MEDYGLQEREEPIPQTKWDIKGSEMHKCKTIRTRKWTVGLTYDERQKKPDVRSLFF